MSIHLQVLLIAILVAAACCLPGVFLVLMKMAMMTDAITHSVLLGITLGYLLTHDLHSPLLLIGASLVGILTVFLVNLLVKTHLLAEDSAIGVVFPFLFSLAIIIISRAGPNLHLDTDSVLLGELAFAPYHRLFLFNIDLGPVSFYSVGSILLINVTLLGLFYKELKLAIFDPAYASSVGFSPIWLSYGLMTSVSITTVGAFEAVGSILVIAFMIGPPMTAYLLTDELKIMIILSLCIGAVQAIIGYQIAVIYDVSIAGTIASLIGLCFLCILLIAPKRGLIATTIARHKKKVALKVIATQQVDA